MLAWCLARWVFTMLGLHANKMTSGLSGEVWRDVRRKVHLSENVEEKLDINVIWNLLNKLPGGVFMQAAQNKRLASQDNNNIYSHDSGIIKRNNCSITYILFNAKHGNYLFFKTQFLSLVKKKYNAVLFKNPNLCTEVDCDLIGASLSKMCL